MIDSMSRWLVGSSISSTSGRPSSTRAIATRILHPPTARRRRRRCSSSKPRPCSTSRARFQLVAAELLVLLLHVAEALEQAVHFVRPRRVGHARLQSGARRGGPRRVRCRRCLVEHRPPGHLGDVLAEVAEVDAFGHPDSPSSGAPRRRSAGRSWSCPRRWGHQAHLLARIELERGLDEHDLAAVLLADRENAITVQLAAADQHGLAADADAGDRPRGAVDSDVQTAAPAHRHALQVQHRTARRPEPPARVPPGSSPVDRWPHRSPDFRRCQTLARTSGCTRSPRCRGAARRTEISASAPPTSAITAPERRGVADRPVHGFAARAAARKGRGKPHDTT